MNEAARQRDEANRQRIEWEAKENERKRKRAQAEAEWAAEAKRLKANTELARANAAIRQRNEEIRQRGEATLQREEATRQRIEREARENDRKRKREQAEAEWAAEENRLNADHALIRAKEVLRCAAIAVLRGGMRKFGNRVVGRDVAAPIIAASGTTTTLTEIYPRIIVLLWDDVEMETCVRSTTCRIGRRILCRDMFEDWLMPRDRLLIIRFG